MPRKRRASPIAEPEKRDPPPPIICPRCQQPIVRGQHIGPLFAPKVVPWAEHPVLSKTVMIRGEVFQDGSPGRSDLSVGEQLRQRAAMGGEKERADLAAFQKLLVETIAQALIEDWRKNPSAGR